MLPMIWTHSPTWVSVAVRVVDRREVFTWAFVVMGFFVFIVVGLGVG